VPLFFLNQFGDCPQSDLKLLLKEHVDLLVEDDLLLRDKVTIREVCDLEEEIKK